MFVLNAYFCRELRFVAILEVLEVEFIYSGKQPTKHPLRPQQNPGERRKPGVARPT